MIRTNSIRRVALCMVLATGLSLCSCGKNKSKEIVIEPEIPAGTVTTLGDYKNFTYEFFDTSMTEEEAVAQYESYVTTYSAQGEKSIAPVEERDGTAVEEGDAIFFNYSATVDGEEIVAKRYGKITVGEGTFNFDAFENALVGLTIGEESKVTITLPDDFADAAYAGKDADFTINVLFVYEEAELTLETGCYWLGVGSLEEAYAGIISTYEAQMETQKNNFMAQQKNNYIQQVIDGSEFKNLDDDIENSYWIAYSMYDTMAKEAGQTVEAYVLENTSYESLADFEKGLKTQAENHIKELVTFNAVADAEGLEFGDAEYQAQVVQLAGENGSAVYDDSGVLDRAATVEKFEAQYEEYYGPGALEYYARITYCEDVMFEKYATEVKEAEVATEDNATEE